MTSPINLAKTSLAKHPGLYTFPIPAECMSMSPEEITRHFHDQGAWVKFVSKTEYVLHCYGSYELTNLRTLHCFLIKSSDPLFLWPGVTLRVSAAECEQRFKDVFGLSVKVEKWGREKSYGHHVNFCRVEAKMEVEGKFVFLEPDPADVEKFTALMGPSVLHVPRDPADFVARPQQEQEGGLRLPLTPVREAIDVFALNGVARPCLEIIAEHLREHNTTLESLHDDPSALADIDRPTAEMVVAALTQDTKAWGYIHSAAFWKEHTVGKHTRALVQSFLQRCSFPRPDVFSTAVKEHTWDLLPLVPLATLGSAFFKHNHAARAHLASLVLSTDDFTPALCNTDLFFAFPWLAAAAIDAHPRNIQYVPTAALSALDPAMVRKTISYDRSLLRYLPDEFLFHSDLFDFFDLCRKTPDTCRRAVAMRPHNLAHVPRRFLTYSLLRAAIMQDHSAATYVPKYLEQRADLLALAAREKEADRAREQKRALAEVTADGMALARVPVRLQTPALCVAAVSQNPHAIQFAAHKTREVFLAGAEACDERPAKRLRTQ